MKKNWFLLAERWRRRFVIGVPTIWFVVFLVIPFLYVLKISFAQSILAQPPFTSLTHVENGTLNIALHFGNYLQLIGDSGLWYALFSSLRLAFIATLLCIVIGYPLAYALTLCKPKVRNILFLMLVLPYWTSFLLRAYAWINILQTNGLVNNFLIHIGLIHTPIRMIYTNFSVGLGLVYGYLPYFILPVYASLLKFDATLIEAASDLGAKPWVSFFRITIPLSLPGILAGSLLVFIPAVGEVVIPQVLGGLNTLLVGNIIWQQFFSANNWCVASALSVIMLIILVLPIVWLQRIESKRGAMA